MLSVKEIINAVEKEQGNISFEEDFNSLNFNDGCHLGKQYMTDQNSKYYRCLRVYCQIFKPTWVLELGTCRGCSALAMAKYSRVMTLDINHDLLFGAIAKQNNIYARLLSKQEDVLDFNPTLYDLIYVDIEHDGKYEQLIHEKLLNSDWHGIAMYDDIGWTGMQKFWESITLEKEATDWHPESGFGIVRY